MDINGLTKLADYVSGLNHVREDWRNGSFDGEELSFALARDKRVFNMNQSRLCLMAHAAGLDSRPVPYPAAPRRQGPRLRREASPHRPELRAPFVRP